MANLNVDLTGVDVQEGFDVLPPGDYHARVSNSEIKEGAKGPYINWEFEIIGKPNRVWDIMSLGNAISLQRLKTMATVCGHPNPNNLRDTEELHGLECIVKLKIEVDKTGTYDDKNRISSFKPMKNKKASAAIPANVPPAHIAAASTTANAAAPGKMPWEE